MLEEEFPLLPPEMIHLGGDGRRGSRRLSKDSKGSKNSSKEFEEAAVKRSRLKVGSGTRASVCGSGRDSTLNSGTLHSLKMKRSSVDGIVMTGSKRISMGGDNLVKRIPTLDSKRSISNEEHHPHGIGRGERRR